MRASGPVCPPPHLVAPAPGSCIHTPRCCPCLAAGAPLPVPHVRKLARAVPSSPEPPPPPLNPPTRSSSAAGISLLPVPVNELLLLSIPRCSSLRRRMSFYSSILFFSSIPHCSSLRIDVSLQLVHIPLPAGKQGKGFGTSKIMARKRNPLVFLDVSIGDDEQDERMVFEIGGMTGVSVVLALFVGFGSFTILLTDDPTLPNLEFG